MKLDYIKQELLSIVSQEINIKDLDLQLVKFFNKKYTIVIKKIQKNKDNLFIDGYICRELQKNIMEENFSFLKRRFFKNKDSKSYIQFLNKISFVDNTDKLCKPSYFKCNFKSELYYNELYNNSQNLTVEKTLIKQEEASTCFA